MAKVNNLSRLKIREVSSVDRPANRGARIMLMKRDGKAKRPKPMTLFQHQESARAAFGGKPSEGPKDRRGRQRHLKMESSLTPEAEAYLKREFTPKQRDRLASSGAAMTGGGYPIESLDDLKNAIQAIGRAKDPAATKAHIKARARALGHADLIPAGWVGKRAERALLKIAADLGDVDEMTESVLSFNQVLTEMSSPSYALGFIQQVKEASHALKDSVKSIACSDDLMPAEKAQAISDSYKQFLNHLSGISPGNITKALKEGVGSMSKLTKKLMKAYAAEPTPAAKTDDNTAALADAAKNATATATTAKQLQKAADKLEKRLAKADARLVAALTMSKAEKDYMDDPDADMDDEKKKIFLDMTTEERTKFIEANPLATIAQKRVASLPEPIRKQLAQSAADSVELAKRVEIDELRDFGKRATEIGQPETFGAHLRTLAKAGGAEEERTKAFDEVMTLLKAAAEQARTSGIFSAFGSNRGATGTAWDQLMGKAEELRADVAKSGGARPLTPEQAFAKVYEDPQNAPLVKQYNEERRRAA